MVLLVRKSILDLIPKEIEKKIRTLQEYKLITSSEAETLGLIIYCELRATKTPAVLEKLFPNLFNTVGVTQMNVELLGRDALIHLTSKPLTIEESELKKALEVLITFQEKQKSGKLSSRDLRKLKELAAKNDYLILLLTVGYLRSFWILHSKIKNRGERYFNILAEYHLGRPKYRMAVAQQKLLYAAGYLGIKVQEFPLDGSIGKLSLLLLQKVLEKLPERTRERIRKEKTFIGRVNHIVKFLGLEVPDFLTLKARELGGKFPEYFPMEIFEKIFQTI